MQSVRDVLRQSLDLLARQPVAGDAIRAGCAEAKRDAMCMFYVANDAIRAGCAEAKHWPRSSSIAFPSMQSVRDVPKRTEGHCVQTIMRRTMK